MRHDTAHRMEALAPKEFSAYMSQLEGGSEAGYNTAVENARTAYRAATGRELPAELAHGEVAADLATNFLKDKNAIDRVRRLAENNPSVADRMYNAVKDLKARVQSLGGRTYLDNATGMSFSYIELRNAERLYEVAMAQAARHSGDAAGATDGTDGIVRYSVEKDDNGNTYIKIDKDILKGVPKNDWIKTVRNVLRDKFKQGIEYNGENVAVSAKSRGEFTRSYYTDNMQKAERADKFRMANNLDEIITTQSNVNSEKPLHPRDDDIVGFERGNTRVVVGNHGFTADVLLANKKDGTKQFYDIINLSRTKIQHSTNMSHNNVDIMDRGNAVSTDMIPQPDDIVKFQNEKNSASECIEVNDVRHFS